MIGTCANPSCSARFKYLHGGRVFQFESSREPSADGNSQNTLLRFWLCSKCSAAMTLARGPQGVVIVTLPRRLRGMLPAFEQPRAA